NGQLVACHILLNASTPDGLRELAEAEGASAIVFGSEYRTPLGRAEPGTSAQKLLDGGALAIAVAAAGLRADGDAAIRRIAVANVDDDAAAARTAQALADRFDASVVDV